MHSRLRAALLAASFLAMAVAARAEIEFAGYVTNGDETKFTLTDRAAQTSSDWLAVGGSFAGYKVTAFDPKGETLTVEKDGAPMTLRLKSARVQAPAATAPAAAVTPPATPAAPAVSEAEMAAARAKLAEAQARLQKLQADRQKVLEKSGVERRDGAQNQLPDLRRIQAEENKRAREAKDAAPPPAANP